MRGTLRFDLDDPDDKLAFERAAASPEMAAVLWSISYDFVRRLREMSEQIEDGTPKLFTADEVIDLLHVWLDAPMQDKIEQWSNV